MDTTAIIKVATATVGVTQLLKNLLPIKKGWLWTILTILVGIAITVVQYLCPSAVLDGCIAISGATIFYDTIYKSFEKIFKGKEDETDGK